MCIGAFVLYVLLGAVVAQAVFDAERVCLCMLCGLCIQLCVQSSVSLSLDVDRATLLYALFVFKSEFMLKGYSGLGSQKTL